MYLRWVYPMLRARGTGLHAGRSWVFDVPSRTWFEIKRGGW